MLLLFPLLLGSSSQAGYANFFNSLTILMLCLAFGNILWEGKEKDREEENLF